MRCSGLLTVSTKISAKNCGGTLKKAAEPVRAEAETLAVHEISNIGPDWSRMRTGVTQHSTYVGLRHRMKGNRNRRPNLANLLMDRAMAPALKSHADQIEHDVGDLLDHLFKQWERM